MTTITAHPAMQDAFRGITEKTEVVDATGNVIGYYTPREFEVELLYQQAEATFDPERIRHQMQVEKDGSSLAEVLERLRHRETP